MSSITEFKDLNEASQVVLSNTPQKNSWNGRIVFIDFSAILLGGPVFSVFNMTPRPFMDEENARVLSEETEQAAMKWLEFASRSTSESGERKDLSERDESRGVVSQKDVQSQPNEEDVVEPCKETPNGPFESSSRSTRGHQQNYVYGKDPLDEILEGYVSPQVDEEQGIQLLERAKKGLLEYSERRNLAFYIKEHYKISSYSLKELQNVISRRRWMHPENLEWNDKTLIRELIKYGLSPEDAKGLVQKSLPVVIYLAMAFDPGNIEKGDPEYFERKVLGEGANLCEAERTSEKKQRRRGKL